MQNMISIHFSLSPYLDIKGSTPSKATSYPHTVYIMPTTVKVRIKAARNLPLSETQTASSVLHGLPGRDPYVIVSLGGHTASIALSEEERMVPRSTWTENAPRYTARTKICRRTLSPVWDEEFRFDVSNDTILQDAPLIFRVCDKEAALGTSQSSKEDEVIGLVYIDLNPLLTTESERGDDTHPKNVESGVMDGWFPLYDTLTGVRGELLLSVKLQFIGDVNPFRDSSAGVRLLPFSTIDPASGFEIVHIFGFVEELVVADDPEFEWNENFREARLSHETRQTLLYLLDASVRRRMCKVRFLFASKQDASVGLVLYDFLTLDLCTKDCSRDGWQCSAGVSSEF